MSSILKIDQATKAFGEVHALRGISFEVAAGEVIGLLGPNGAGKSTLIRSMTTLEQLDSGSIYVCGTEVQADPRTARTFIGYAGQDSALDKVLTGREFMRFQAGLVHLPKAEVKQRSDFLLDRFNLTEAADRFIESYSGGMKRRLDLASSLMHKPRLLILDEPSAGLDYESRRELWALLAELKNEGTSLLLATHDFEEADVLSTRAVMMSHGSVVGAGTPDELRAQLGCWVLSAAIGEHSSEADRESLRKLFNDVPGTEMPAAPQSADYAKAVAAGHEDAAGTPWTEWLRAVASKQGMELRSVSIRRPSLQDAYLAATRLKKEVSA
ncbi:MAG: ABC transporter ATP-binding protein [Planctomycetota bacterium]|jgi:ABC-2 type transport system ATP-binding protein|nr:ABC transporter ATP-binding protein [Planctomycetota bacterium]